jgi:hypothetical protein
MSENPTLPNIKLLNQKFVVPQPNYSFTSQQFEQNMESIRESIAEVAKKRATYKEEVLRSLHAIEENTANLYLLVDLINHSNDQQDELIELITEILAIAKAKNKTEVKNLYEKTIGKIAEIVKDGEALAKLLPFATTVYNIAKTTLENQ